MDIEIPTSIAKKALDAFHEWHNTDRYVIRVFGKRKQWGMECDMEIIVGYDWDCGDGCCSDTEWQMNTKEVKEFGFTPEEIKWLEDNVKREEERDFSYYP